jgi:two-component SAPR family response regulator
LRARLLIVDDDELVRASLQLEATEKGYRVATADSGEAALELARGQNFDLIICDIRMPGIGGLETIRLLRQSLPTARVIVITGYASPDTPVKALRMRVDDYLMKPFDGPTFLKSVANALQERDKRPDQVSSQQAVLTTLLRQTLGSPGTRLAIAERAATRAFDMGFSPGRIRKLYLAALLLGLDPSLLRSFPGLQWQAVVVEEATRVRAGEVSDFLEARLLAEVGTDLLTQGFDIAQEGGDDLVEVDDSDIGLDNCLRLAHKYRTLSRFEEAARIYRECLESEQNPESRLRVRFHQLVLAVDLSEEEKARALLSSVQSESEELGLPLLAAKATLELARISPISVQDLKAAMDVFIRWDEGEEVNCCQLLIAASGDAEARAQWALSPYAELTARRFPEPASLLADDAFPARDESNELWIQLLGPLRVSYGKRSVGAEDWASKKDRLLLAYLCTQADTVTTEDELLELFWPKGGAKSRHSLHNSVSQVRKVLSRLTGYPGRDLLCRVQDGYRIGTLVHTDLSLFERELQAGQQAASAGDWEKALVLLHKADRTVVGDFMEGDYQEWTFPVRDRIRELHLECLELLADYFQRRQRRDKALQLWRRVLQLDDCHERAYLCSLMLCRESDDKSKAVQIYRKAQEVYQRELGLDLPPSFQEILSQF